MKFQHVVVFGVFAIVGMVLGCGSTGATRGALVAGRPVAEGPFTQTPVADGIVDILFMLDSSVSLADERAKLEANVPALISELGEVESAAIGFALGWATPTASSVYGGTGRLFSTGTNPKVLLHVKGGVGDDQLQSAVAATIESLQDSPDSLDAIADGGEAEMFSLKQLLITYRRDAVDEGFLRPGAGLAVIFISDENDMCAIYPDGVTPVGDPDEIEAVRPDYPSFCPKGISGRDLYDRAKSSLTPDGTKLGPVQFSGIVNLVGFPTPDGSEKETGYGYLDAIAVSSGVQVDLASVDFSRGLKNLGNAINALVSGIQREFELHSSPVISSSIVVRVDGEAVSFRYDRAKNVVILDYAGHKGSVVTINYRVLD